MGNSGNKKIKIKVKKATGEIVYVKHENDDDADDVTEQELQQIYDSPDGFRYVAVILYAESNPKCIYVVRAGKAYKICY
jgi:hypothetical protein